MKPFASYSPLQTFATGYELCILSGKSKSAEIMVMRYAALLLLLLGSSALAADQITFRGAYIGQPVSDFVDCSLRKPRPLKDGFKSHGNICEGKKGTVWRIKSHARILSGNGTSEDGEIFLFEERKVIRIKILIGEEAEWEKVKYDLTEKLGPPTSDVPQIYQNGFGARWEYDQGFWIHDSTVAYAGVKVSKYVTKIFGNDPATEGIEINITDTDHAKLPSSRPSTLD